MTIRHLCVLGLAITVAPAFAQTRHQPGSHAGQHTGQLTRRRQQSFTDYALGKINPGNVDVGRAYQEAREQIVHNTIDDLYFWSNCMSLTLLIGVTGFFFLHLRSADKKERIAATLIAQMWNGRVSDKIEIGRRTEWYNALTLHPETHGAIQFNRNGWKSPGVRPIAISKHHERYEAMLLMEPGQWVASDRGRREMSPATRQLALQGQESAKYAL
jgi:hypothetical protein